MGLKSFIYISRDNKKVVELKYNLTILYIYISDHKEKKLNQ